MVEKSIRLSFLCFSLLATCVANGVTPIHVPLKMQLTTIGSYKANIDVGIGTLAPIPFTLDTGSTGLHAYKAAKLDAPNSGVRCTTTPTKVVYGNPPRIIFSGVICYAKLHFDTMVTTAEVPIAYLTSASCPPTNPQCTIPDLEKPQGRVMGILGVGLAGIISGEGQVPPPFHYLPNSYNAQFSLKLKPSSGELIFGDKEPTNAIRFQMLHGQAAGQDWALGKGCLFVNGILSKLCPVLSFDTGNGVPWIHASVGNVIPSTNGLVKASTRIGFAPIDGKAEATSVVASASPATMMKMVEVSVGTNDIANPGIDAFFDHVVTYDRLNGYISFAPTN